MVWDMSCLVRGERKNNVQLWEHVLPKTKINLNTFYLYLLHHQLFEKFYIAWQFNYGTNKIGHHGNYVVENVKYTYRLYFSPHGNTVCYIVTRLYNYHCHIVYINKSREEKVSDTIEIFTKLQNEMYESWICNNGAEQYSIQLLLSIP